MTGEALLEEVMEPLLPFLRDKATEDVAMQVPGEAWVYARSGWRCERVPIDAEQMWEIAKLTASLIRRDLDESKPFLDTTLPAEERFGGGRGAPPRFFAAVPGAVEVGKTVFTTRKPDTGVPRWKDAPERYNTEGWNQWRRFRTGRDLSKLLDIFRKKEPEAIWEFLPAAVRAKLSILFVGDTGAGKTTMSKMAATAMGPAERIVTIEDAIELVLEQPNNVRFLYPSDGAGPVTVHTLQEAALRSRPDRILIQEIRQAEVASIYVRQSGHRGTLATIHGGDAAGGLQHLFQLYKGSAHGQGLSDKLAADMIANMVDVVIPLARDGAGEVVSVGPTWFVADAESRGETAVDLLR